MSAGRPLPDFFYPLARVVLVLKALLAATAPEGFAAVSAEVHRALRYAGACLRRYLLAVARTLTLPPLRLRPASPAPPPPRTGPSRRSIDAPFALAEPPPERRAPGPRPACNHCDYVEWALAWQRTQAMLAALRNPLPVARRLARRLARGLAPVLRARPAPPFVLRGLPAFLAVLPAQLHRLACPGPSPGCPPDTG